MRKSVVKQLCVDQQTFLGKGTAIFRGAYKHSSYKANQMNHQEAGGTGHVPHRSR